MSEIEQLYLKLRTTFGGTRDWKDLNPMEQHQFVNAVNAIIQVAQSR